MGWDSGWAYAGRRTCCAYAASCSQCNEAVHAFHTFLRTPPELPRAQGSQSRGPHRSLQARAASQARAMS